jgi:DNA-binding IclR family transcriptional regulator
MVKESMIQSVRRAVSLLELLDHAGPGGLSLSAIAASAELKVPTAHHLINTLVNLGYAAQDPASRHYVLGKAAVALGSVRTVTDRLSRIAEPIVADVHREVDETVVLALYADGMRHTIECRESDQPLRVGASTGVDAHLYGTATGRVLLSLLDGPELRGFIASAGLPGAEWPEAASEADLRRALAEIRDRELAEFRRTGNHVVALAVPVRFQGPAPRVAVGLYYPAVRDDSARRRELEDALHRAATSISAEFERI